MSASVPSERIARSSWPRNVLLRVISSATRTSAGPPFASSPLSRSATRSVSATAKSAPPSRTPPFSARSSAGRRSAAPPTCGSAPRCRIAVISCVSSRRRAAIGSPSAGRMARARSREGAKAHFTAINERRALHSKRWRERSSYGGRVALISPLWAEDLLQLARQTSTEK